MAGADRRSGHRTSYIVQLGTTLVHALPEAGADHPTGPSFPPVDLRAVCFVRKDGGMLCARVLPLFAGWCIKITCRAEMGIA